MVGDDDLISIIKQCSFFSILSNEEINEILPFFVKLTLKPGQTLFARGDTSESVYILIQGNLIGILPHEPEADEIIGSIFPIESVGELGVITGELRSLTIKANEQATLLKLSGKIFLELCARYPLMSLEIMRLISRRSINTIKFIS